MMDCKKQLLFYEVIFDEKRNIIPKWQALTSSEQDKVNYSWYDMHYKRSDFLTELSLKKTVFGRPLVTSSWTRKKKL